MFKNLGLFFTLFFTSCSQTTILYPYPAGWQLLWSSPVVSAFSNQDMTPYCPNWKSVDQSAVWLRYWQNIVQYESDFDPNSSYIENDLGIDPVTRKQVMSDGLLQLSYQDVLVYTTPNCNKMSYTINPKNIFDPIINLSCGMDIANSLLSQGRNLDAYWSTARTDSEAFANFKSTVPQCF